VSGIFFSRAEEEGFIVVASQQEVWTKEMASEFYADHRGKPFFEDLVTYMTSGPVLKLCLEKADGIAAWRKLIGPSDPNQAKVENPTSIRAVFGTDGTKNTVHGSDSFASAVLEIGFCFPEPFQSERTLALIKPGATELHSGKPLRVRVRVFT
ncbi:unnamed protein product, partial [Discosporangium mesarthrocarpum]